MWKTNENKSVDKLTFEFFVDVAKEYKNVSKHKRVLTPVVKWKIIIYANELRLNEDEDEVFVITEFFNSLAQQGKFPMYTCSCGIFGCGGFYVNVLYEKDTVIWDTEQSSIKKFIFSKENVLHFAEELIEKLMGLNDLLQENGLHTYHEIDIYRAKVEYFARPNHKESN
ncbi:MAG: hypothetical protein ACQEXV_00535 [Bacillota bacterium]|uniref:hypothetical protein n=1 Tax=Paenibacillus sp. 23TSA30-6 TaxID=2546104 RepID=UPI0017889ED4|nr:hypothetical protein [Paenibacillus sp. 23TSA30-6]MBE0339529.1 hypothetical protein [Paenibacillus sp. 23TSA30-6]